MATDVDKSIRVVVNLPQRSSYEVFVFAEPGHVECIRYVGAYLDTGGVSGGHIQWDNGWASNLRTIYAFVHSGVISISEKVKFFVDDGTQYRQSVYFRAPFEHAATAYLTVWKYRLK
jgi:hypothetical protein